MTDLKKSLWIDAPVDEVFDYFAVGEKVAIWSGVEAEMDAVPGGVYHIDMGSGGIILGQFVTVEAPSLLSFELEPPPDMDRPRVRVDVRLHEEVGGTRVSITQYGISPPFDQISTRAWDHHLARLSVAATGGNPGTDSLCSRTMNTMIGD